MEISVLDFKLLFGTSIFILFFICSHLVIYFFFLVPWVLHIVSFKERKIPVRGPAINASVHSFIAAGPLL